MTRRRAQGGDQVGAGGHARRRLLVVASPFPPAASAGTTRVLRFLRHLPDHGWDPVVMAPTARGPAPEPAWVPVVRTSVPLPQALQRGGRRVTRLNRWLFVPDPFIAWLPGAMACGRRLLRETHVDAVFSSQPRASAHLAAAALSRAADVPWLADYRDPWSTYAYRRDATRLHGAAQRRLEARTLRRAAAVSAVNRPILDDLVARHPWLEGRTHVLPNGFDAAEPRDEVHLGEGFWIVYTGRLYWREAALDAFLRALATLPDDVKALFVGDDGRRAEAAAQRLGLLDRVRVEPFLPHAQALGCQRAAQALLLITGTRAESMSSKVFEYLASGRPVFAVTPPHSAAGALLREVGGAVCAPPDDRLPARLAGFVAAVRRGEGPQADAAALTRYDMAQVTADLAALLDRLVDARSRDGGPSPDATAGRPPDDGRARMGP